MISGIFHQGSGLGNQLHRYVATRVLALDKGYDFSMVAPENFKGGSFMNLDMGSDLKIPYVVEHPAGKVVPQTFEPVWEEKTNYYNPEFNFIEGNTIIDGEFQDERYFEHRLNEVDDWLKVEPLYPRTEREDDGCILSCPGVAPDNLCIIGFRGGEFYTVPELGLPASYYAEGVEYMLKINPKMQFEVHTDDEALAKQFFPEFKVVRNIGVNWRSVRFSRYSIIANSSFYILPRLLAHFTYRNYEFKTITIAPRYWARRNTEEWSMPQNYYKKFTYI